MRSISQFIQKWVQGGVFTVMFFLLTLTLLIGFIPSDIQLVYALEENLYLDGVNGDDENDGLTEATAILSFEKAKEIATINTNVKNIYVVNTVTVTGDINLDGTSAILMRNPGYSGHLLKISKEVTLSNITIDGGGENELKTRAAMIIIESGTLNIQDGTVLQNNIHTNTTGSEARGGAVLAAYSDSKKVINMTGGVIKNNNAFLGGGIFLFDHSVFNMSGGVIKKNSACVGEFGGNRSGAYGSGGGIAAFRDAKINISEDAMITENKAEELGGGISVGTYVAPYEGNTLNMTGGVISKNTAGSAGGGIFIQVGTGTRSSIANISAGQIIGNSMTGQGWIDKEFGGGGIYVNGETKENNQNNGVLNLNNALITRNTSLFDGGGYASCPVSDTDINVKNGVAIYGNYSYYGAKDLYIESGTRYGKNHSGSPNYAISAFMLGGTPYRWLNEKDEELPINKLSGVLDGDNNERLELHTEVTDDAAAEELATVIIADNYSRTRGGGIGSNGIVNTGEKKVIKIKVNKSWKYDDVDTRPKSIIIELYRENTENPTNPIYIGAETMEEKDEKWEIIFKNIPKLDQNDNPYKYFVKEVGADGYSVKITGNQNTGYNLVNIPGTNIQVEKKWNGESTEKVEIKLLADGATKAKFTLTEAEGWKHIFENLPKFDANDGHEIVYTVEESAISGYISAITGDATNGYIVTNTKTTTPPEPENPNTPENPNPNPPGNNTPSNPPTPSRPSRPSTPTPSTPGSSTPPTSTPPTPTVAGESRPTPTPDSNEVVDAVATPDPEHIPQVLGESREVAGNKRDTPTGDSSHLLLWAGFFSLSVLGLSFYGLRKSKKR